MRVKEPAPIYDKHGAEFELPQVTITAIEWFKVPDGFQQEGAREDSFMYSLGNYYTPADLVNKSSRFTAFYKCQLRNNKIKYLIFNRSTRHVAD